MKLSFIDQEILERSLAELGLEDLPAIETFWHDNIVKYRQKLLEAQRRLELRWLEVNGHVTWACFSNYPSNSMHS